jgi:putative acetyltransferase
MAVTLLRTTSANDDFRTLVSLLDRYLQVCDGDEHAFYAQYNKIDAINNVVVAYAGVEAIGCGAFKPFEENVVEIKRMYVMPGHRNKGVAAAILGELENWAAENGNSRCVLETGKRMSDAVGFYQKSGYAVRPNFGQYEGVDDSVCFEKQIS